MINKINHWKKYSLILFSILLTLLSFNINKVFAEDITYFESPWIYRLDGDTVTIVKYVGNDAECEVPWTLGGKEIKKVESIQNDKVRKIIIPNNDIEIGPDVSHDYVILYYNLNGEILDTENNLINNDNDNDENIDDSTDDEDSGFTFFDFIRGNTDSKEENTEENKEDRKALNTDSKKPSNNKNNQNKSNKTTTEPFKEREDDPFKDESTNDNTSNEESIGISKSNKSNFPYFTIACIGVVIIVVYYMSKKFIATISSPSGSRKFKRIKRKILNKFR